MAPEGFDEWYEATYPRLWSWVRRLVPDRESADDVAQEAMLRLIQSGRDRLPESERAAYLFGIAMNVIRDRWRATSKTEVLSPEAVEATVAPTADGDSAIDLERALADLPARQRAIAWLAMGEGWDHRHIARAVGVREGSVKVLLFRARKALMARLRNSR